MSSEETINKEATDCKNGKAPCVGKLERSLHCFLFFLPQSISRTFGSNVFKGTVFRHYFGFVSSIILVFRICVGKKKISLNNLNQDKELRWYYYRLQALRIYTEI